MLVRHERTSIMHRMVENDGVLYLGGITADDCELDMTGQSRQVFRKLADLLTSAGSSKGALLSVQIFLTDMAGKEDMNEAWLEWLDSNDLPARATIGVADLGPGTLIEVVATAAIR